MPSHENSLCKFLKEDVNYAGCAAAFIEVIRPHADAMQITMYGKRVLIKNIPQEQAASS
jgi:hypothetical protein